MEKNYVICNLCKKHIEVGPYIYVDNLEKEWWLEKDSKSYWRNKESDRVYCNKCINKIFLEAELET